MKTSKNTKALIVAIFTLVGISIFIVGIFALGGLHKLFSSSVTLKASFENINGLQAGNNVWFEGVNIGSVKSVSFQKGHRVEVVMNIEKKSCRYIPCDAKAKIGSDGLIGNRIVIIEGGTQLSPIKNDDTIAVEKAFTGEDLANTLQHNNLNLLEITNNLKKVSSGLANGEGTLGGLLTNRSLLDNLQSITVSLKQASENTKRLTSNLVSYSSKLQTGGTFSNDVITDTIIFSRLRTIVYQIDNASNTINKTVDNLQTASQSFNDKNKPIGAFVHDQRITDSIKVLLTNLNSASRKLNEDLEAMQHNFLLRAYFKKKEKQENKSTGN